MDVLSRRAWLLALAAAASAAPWHARAQSYPEHPIRFVVPYPPGGGTDVIARIVQGKLQTALGQNIVIDNKGGAGGSVGTDVVAKAPADGYTVLFTLNSHTVNPAIYAKLPFDTLKDFEPVGTVASLPQILVAHPAFPANSVAELIAMAKAKPGTLAYASVGVGSPGHLAGELFKLRTGTQMTHVPYRGGGPAVTDVMGGQVPLLWVSIPAAAQHVKSGKLKALGVSTLKRSAAFPDVPTLQEAGVADFEVDSWYAMFVPAKTPKPVIDKLSAAIAKALKSPDVVEKIQGLGNDAVGTTPEEFAAVLKKDRDRWTPVIKASGFKAE